MVENTRKCFWPKCSDRARCDKFGSCVALAQRAAITNGDFPSSPQQPEAQAGVMEHCKNLRSWANWLRGWENEPTRYHYPVIAVADALDAARVELEVALPQAGKSDVDHFAGGGKMVSSDAGVVTIAHDGFQGDVIGSYVTREGKRGVVLQQVGTRVVHVYGEKWLKPAPGGTDE